MKKMIFDCNVVMIYPDYVRCNATLLKGKDRIELGLHMPNHIFEKYGVPLDGAQCFKLTLMLPDTIDETITSSERLEQAIIAMEAYTPPMTKRKKKLLDEIMKL